MLQLRTTATSAVWLELSWEPGEARAIITSQGPEKRVDLTAGDERALQSSFALARTLKYEIPYRPIIRSECS